MSKDWMKQSPWPERFEAGWENMSREHKREFLAESWQQHLKEQYEMALEFSSVKGTPWEELSQDQKDSVEVFVKQHAQDMQTFGASLSGTTEEMEAAGRKLTGLDK